MQILLKRSSELSAYHDQILALHNTVFPSNPYSTYPEVLGKYPDPHWLLAIEDGKVLAICAIGEESTHNYIYNVAVAEDQRRKGIARSMAEILRKNFAGKTLRGVVEKDNLPANMFYLSLGAELLERFDYNTYSLKF